MGRRVLSASLAFPGGPAPNASLSMHANCDTFGNGGVVLAYVNSGNASISVALAGALTATTPRTEYVLTSTALDSDDVFLNGALLSVASDGSIATPVAGKPVAAGGDPTLTLPGWSLGFFALPGAAAFACRNF